MHVPVNTPTKCLDCHTPITMLVVSLVFFCPIHQPSFIDDILIMSTLYPHYIPHFPLYLHYIPIMYVCEYKYIYIYKEIDR